ncbi:MAG: hypothetical protein KNN13_02445 [Hydrogenobacter thermophilus]|uniref:hypothetical protein n=1 Tax=Hydrogenobacter thermophilus TaxID=940 RepID=UPI001C76203F|nr:hypothetical protein [Hydrogenobacter thermophilus]QWK20206.1 MAG: hypothetical protein KNN13_02445 [Hydrogenobacter thermophilus]
MRLTLPLLFLLFLFSSAQPVRITVGMRLPDMPALSNDDTVSYLEDLYRRSVEYDQKLKILEDMWSRSPDPAIDHTALDNLRIKRQALESAISKFQTVKDEYISSLRVLPTSRTSSAIAYDTQSAIRNLIIRIAETKQNLDLLVPALSKYYPDYFFLERSMQETRAFNALISRAISSLSDLAKLGFYLFSSPLFEFGYVNVGEEQMLKFRRTLWIYTENIQGILYLDIPGAVYAPIYAPAPLDDFKFCSGGMSRCYSFVSDCLFDSLGNLYYAYWYITPLCPYPCTRSDYFKMIGQPVSFPSVKWDLKVDPSCQAYNYTDYDGRPVFRACDPYNDARFCSHSLPAVLIEWKFTLMKFLMRLSGICPNEESEPFWEDGRIRDNGTTFYQEYYKNVLCTCNASPPEDFWFDQCGFTSDYWFSSTVECKLQLVGPPDPCDTSSGACPLLLPLPQIPLGIRDRCATTGGHYQRSPVPAPVPVAPPDFLPDEYKDLANKVNQLNRYLYDLDNELDRYPYVITLPYTDYDVSTSPDVALAPDTLISPDISLDPDIELSPQPVPLYQPDIQIVVDTITLAPHINWLISQEVQTATGMIDAIVSALPDTTDECKAQESMMYANLDDLKNVLIGSYKGIAVVFGFTSAVFASASILRVFLYLRRRF